MWNLSGNEKTQEQLDAYPRAMKFKKADDDAKEKKTISLASVIWRMVFLQEPTYYTAKHGSQTHQCAGTRARSVEDIYSTAKNYVKNMTREKVEEAIDKLCNANLISQHFCDTVQRRVHTAANLKITLTEVKKALNGK